MNMANKIICISQFVSIEYYYEDEAYYMLQGYLSSKWESGQSDPSTTNLMALAKLFQVTPEELLREVYH